MPLTTPKNNLHFTRKVSFREKMPGFAIGFRVNKQFKQPDVRSTCRFLKKILSIPFVHRSNKSNISHVLQQIHFFTQQRLRLAASIVDCWYLQPILPAERGKPIAWTDKNRRSRTTSSIHVSSTVVRRAVHRPSNERTLQRSSVIIIIPSEMRVRSVQTQTVERKFPGFFNPLPYDRHNAATSSR